MPRSWLGEVSCLARNEEPAAGFKDSRPKSISRYRCLPTSVGRSIPGTKTSTLCDARYISVFMLFRDCLRRLSPSEFFTIIVTRLVRKLVEPKILRRSTDVLTLQWVVSVIGMSFSRRFAVGVSYFEGKSIATSTEKSNIKDYPERWITWLVGR